MGKEGKVRYQFYCIKFKYPLISMFLLLVSNISSEKGFNSEKKMFYKEFLFCLRPQYFNIENGKPRLL